MLISMFFVEISSFGVFLLLISAFRYLLGRLFQFYFGFRRLRQGGGCGHGRGAHGAWRCGHATCGHRGNLLLNKSAHKVLCKFGR